MTYQIILDIWEGNPALDADTLINGGVVGLIPRLNDIHGGHHRDAAFDALWELAIQFEVRWLYFVYNPWVDGPTNFDWLRKNAPSGLSRLDVDIEVKYQGTSPAAYANEVDKFLSLALPVWPRTEIYTGEWFLPTLAQWPSRVGYWWARYPYALYPDVAVPISWEELRGKLDAMEWAPDPSQKAPGPIKRWQCTADRYVLPGCGGSCVDINIFNGTLEELKEYAGVGHEPSTKISDREKLKRLWEAHPELH